MTISSPSTKATLQLDQTLSPPLLTSSPAWQASFSIDGKYLAVCFGNPDTCIKVWEYLGKNSVDTVTAHNGVVGAGSDATSKGSKTVDCCTDTNNTKSNTNHVEWKLIATIREGHSRTIRSVAFAPTSSTLGVPILASASFDGKVLIWEHFADEENVEYNEYDGGSSNTDRLQPQHGTFEPIAQLEGHENEIKHLAWNQTGSLLASCGRDKTIWIWECFLPGTVGGSTSGGGGDDEGEFECLAVLQGHEGDVKSIAFALSHGQWGEGDEILLSASYDNSIKVWAEESGDWYCAATLGVNDAAAPPPRPLASGDSSLVQLEGRGAVHTSTVWCLGINPGGVRFLSGSEDGSMAIWKMYTATERKRLFPREHAVSSTDGLWNCVGRLPDAHAGYAVLSVDCAPSRAGHGRIASGGGDNCIQIYREETGGSGAGSSSDAPKFAIEAMAINAHDGDVNCVKWYPRDGTSLVSCGDDGAVRIWKYSLAG